MVEQVYGRRRLAEHDFDRRLDCSSSLDANLAKIAMSNPAQNQWHKAVHQNTRGEQVQRKRPGESEIRPLGRSRGEQPSGYNPRKQREISPA
jgi:hypothetical protein